MTEEWSAKRLQQLTEAKRRELGLSVEGRRPLPLRPVGEMLGSLVAAGSSAEPEKLAWTCECGLTVPPLRLEVLGGVHYVRGNCSVCAPKLREERRRHEAAEAAARAESRLGRYRREFPAEHMGTYASATLANFDKRLGTESALRWAQQFTSVLPRPEDTGLYLWSHKLTGNGKSHLAAAIANAARQAGMAAVWVSAPAFLARLAGDHDGREHLKELAARADLLVLDDLGAGNLSPAKVAYVLYLVEERTRLQLPLVVTANYDLDKLALLLNRASAGGDVGEGIDGERITDRLMVLCRQVELTAPSYREELARRRAAKEDGT